MRLEGKVALITGGTSGIGRAMVERFVAEGAAVTFTGLPEQSAEDGAALERTLGERGGQARYEPLDVRELDRLREVIRATARAAGRLDVMVNNAGVAIPGTILETTPDEFDLLFQINVRSVFFGTQWAAEQMRERGGAIVNTASTAAIRGLRERAAYCGTKGAVLQLSKAAALDLAPFRIRVNCVSPGAIDTPLLRRARFSGEEDPDEAVAELGRTLPLGRIGYPRDIAAAALYLASDEAEWLTGANIVVDGGGTV